MIKLTDLDLKRFEEAGNSLNQFFNGHKKPGDNPIAYILIIAPITEVHEERDIMVKSNANMPDLFPFLEITTQRFKQKLTDDSKKESQ